MSIRLSIALLTHNELSELTCLLDALGPLSRRDDVEIVVVDDYSDRPMLDLFEQRGIAFQQRKLDNDFASQRNFAKQACRGDYILFLDPDEMPSDLLLASLFPLCALMDEAKVDACSFPRLNVIVQAEKPPPYRSLSLSNLNFDGVDPDYQLRLCRNKPAIFWKHSVHEKLSGVERCFRFAVGVDNALFHVKTAKQQMKQNSKYDSIDAFSIRNIAVRLRLRPLASLLGFIEEPHWIPSDLRELAINRRATTGVGA